MTLYFHIGKDGSFENSGDFQTSPEELQTMVSNLTRPAIDIVIHGGLVSEENGMDNARLFINSYQSTSNELMFVIWETGPIETLKQNLGTVLGRSALKFSLKVARKLFTKKFKPGFKSVSDDHGQVLDDDEINEKLIEALTEQRLDKASVQIEISQDIDDLIFSDPLLMKELEQEQLLYDSQTHRKGFIKVLLLGAIKDVVVQSIIRFASGTHHQIIPTLLEELVQALYFDEFGKGLWDAMKNKSSNMFDADVQQERTGVALLRHLDTLYRDQSEAKKIEINLIGHSAGAIVICDLLDHIVGHYPNLKLNNITFIAPAVTAERAVESLVNNQVAFNKFRMFTMTDELEKQDDCKTIYPASLLYLISGILEDRDDTPITGMMRFYDNDKFIAQEGVAEWKAFIHQDSQLALSVNTDSPDGFKTNSRAHGGFGHEKETVKSIQYFNRP
ncbi:hypothetical protein VCR12J2_620750 [Vibrio coralliirubri]|uniref:hypothetical protein n=1 Tax=Vibrio coralliirubri TaxID=1516159 RepID=UPI000631ED86|nr:hypothetical protein [Vibrio coralliirubri]CDU02272.1 hypothetical protein VCR12J2_620750 [Vibrio coralliirubri]